MLKDQKQIDKKTKEFYDEKTNGSQSFTDRTINIYLAGTDDALSIGAKTSTTVREVQETLGSFFSCDPGVFTVKRKLTSGLKVQMPSEECASSIVVSGVVSFRRKERQYEHPILIVGGGLGGIQCARELQDRGRTDIIIVDKNHDFGGHSWIKVPNKFTKLQTERGTYHFDYIKPYLPVTKEVEGKPYKTWPSRDQLLAMMREGCKAHGIYRFAMFNTGIKKVTPKGDSYAVKYLPLNEEEDGGIMMTATVSAWPGFLHNPNTVDFPGEEDFNGYIEYSSFDQTDYTLCTGKTVCLYGHGAFTIENVRTLCEFRAKKIWVVCRTRNLSGTKMASWMVGAQQRPLPALVLIDMFQAMYDLVGFDCWTSHGVTTDEKRSYAHISQKTIFGVTDIYFLAGYYGLMEVVVDEIKRVSHHCVHTKKYQKIDCDVIIKAIGTAPSFDVDKDLGIKEMVGWWVNGDPRRPIFAGSKGVSAKNFGSFSVGPGLAPLVKVLNYFIDYPEDWDIVKDKLPVNKAGKWPAYVTEATYGLQTGIPLNNSLPMLAAQSREQDAIKARKQVETHPMEQYLSECRTEWEMYIKYFKENGLVNDRPDPPYPYTMESMHGYYQKAEAVHSGGNPYAP